MYIRNTLIVVAIVLLMPIPATSQAVPRPFSMRNAPVGDEAETTNVVNVWLPVTELHEVLSASDLVLHGVVLAVQSHFSEDESMVVTDYTISPTRLIKQRRPLNIAALPGPTRPLVVRCVGGEFTDGGRRYSTGVSIYPHAVRFRTGEEVILMLVHNENEDVYELGHGPYGAFRVVNGDARPMTKAVTEKRLDVPRPIAGFLAELERLAGPDK